MIKALIFDNYGVLMDSIIESLESIVPDDVYTKIAEASHLSDNGQTSAEVRLDTIFHLLNQIGLDGPNEIKKARVHSRRNDQLFNFIKENRSKYSMAILSNASDDINKIYPPGSLNDYFDQIVWSYEVKMVKPSREIYQLVANRLKVKPSECIFIDDKPVNVKAAEAVGMEGIVYSSFDDFHDQLTRIISRA